ncbi:MAG TPA: HEAT repeat domain-containing protein [Pirellulaceae bacterium]|nr:HEAT repeat domain-containing protein [Pirellulaceae bacterium]
MNTRLRTSIALASAAMVIAVSGCGRTPPTPVRANPPAAKPADGDLLVTHEGPEQRPQSRTRATIRDESVAPASLEVVVPTPKSEQQLAADALTRIGPPAVPMLVEALRGTDDEVRRQACQVLVRMGPDAKEAVPELVNLLDDPDEDLRRMAATALGRIGPDAGEAVPALMRRLLEGETPPPPAGEPQRFPPR